MGGSLESTRGDNQAAGDGGGRRDEPGRIRDEAGVQVLATTIGRYLLLRRIARGGMGEVFLASTTGIEGAERPVVVKIIRREHASDPSFVARFLDEARVQAQLSHSGVAQVLDAALDESTGEPYVVVEWVEGKSLGDVRARALQTGVRIGWADAVSIATLVAEALAHVHERKDASGRALAIVHRDLSPQNVMVGYAGDVKIIDFGTARGQNRRCHTVAGVVFAKPGYVAPEVANGDPGDARVDLYALGIMLWELCANKRFLQGEASEHMARVAKNAENPPPIAAACGAPLELDAIVARLTAFDRDARYLAARTAAADLARVLAAAPPLASGERGTRARVAELMRALFPSEPAKSRREFARLVAAVRANAPHPPPRPAATQATLKAPAEEGLLPGTRYRLLREIARGASSVVWEAEQLDLGRRVALKVQDRAGAEAAQRMMREARALGRLRHDNIVELYDAGTTPDGRRWAAMQLLEGETLENLLSRCGGCTPREALRIAAEVLAALEVVHAEGFVHRDVKPANVMLCLDGAVKLLDFGLARCDADDPEEPMLAEMTLFGTPEYMAPEQAGGGIVDGRADLYALGCVLYEMITGRVPFVAEGAVGILDAKRRGSPERPRDRAPARGIPRELDELTMRALARHPSVRFQSAAEMRAAVIAALEVPVRRRAKRRAIGFASLALAMGFASVLLAGKAGEVWSAVRTAAAPITARLSPAAPAPVEVAAAEPPASREQAAEDDVEAADDDEPFVDDTPEVIDLDAEPAAAEQKLSAPASSPDEGPKVAADAEQPVERPARSSERRAARKKEERRRSSDASAKEARTSTAAATPPAASPTPAPEPVADTAPVAVALAPPAPPDPAQPAAPAEAVAAASGTAEPKAREDAPAPLAAPEPPLEPPPAVVFVQKDKPAATKPKPPSGKSTKIKKNTHRKKPKSRRAQK